MPHWLSRGGPAAFIPGVNFQAQIDSEEDRQDRIAYTKSLGAAPTVQATGSSDR